MDGVKSDRSHVAAVYSARYISDRFLPDKAIDLVDEAASALRLAQESKPDALELLERQIVTLQVSESMPSGTTEAHRRFRSSSSRSRTSQTSSRASDERVSRRSWRRSARRLASWRACGRLSGTG